MSWQSSASLGSEWDLSESSVSSLSLPRSSERLSETPGSFQPPSLEVRITSHTDVLEYTPPSPPTIHSVKGRAREEVEGGLAGIWK